MSKHMILISPDTNRREEHTQIDLANGWNANDEFFNNFIKDEPRYHTCTCKNANHTIIERIECEEVLVEGLEALHRKTGLEASILIEDAIAKIKRYLAPHQFENRKSGDLNDFDTRRQPMGDINHGQWAMLRLMELYVACVNNPTYTVWYSC